MIQEIVGVVQALLQRYPQLSAEHIARLVFSF
jgi:hypothetical protein